MDPLFFIIILIFIILVPLCLGMTIPVQKKHNEATGGVVNYDIIMSKFVFKVYLTKDEIINSLKIKNVKDELFCDFDFERSVVIFSEYSDSTEYYFYIFECKNGFSILKLEQVSHIGMQSRVSMKLNPFMVSKLGAEIVPFSKYGF